jgi:hypothetical protein
MTGMPKVSVAFNSDKGKKLVLSSFFLTGVSDKICK